MIKIKKTQRSVVQRLGSGHYRKSYLWQDARLRFANEVAVLLHLEKAGCNFVPRLVSACAGALTITTTSCGQPVQQLAEQKIRDLYARLEKFGVRHEDAELRNIVYDSHRGHFAIIDFEFAKILSPDIRADDLVQDLFQMGFEASLATQSVDERLQAK